MKRILFFLCCCSCFSGHAQKWERPVFSIVHSTSFFYIRNDTIFCLLIYKTDTVVDSIRLNMQYIKLSSSRWMSDTNINKNYVIQKFKKIKSSDFFVKHNNKLFVADAEMKKKEIQTIIYYYSDGTCIKSYYFGFIKIINLTHDYEKTILRICEIGNWKFVKELTKKQK